ncbi:MAG: hypothetical protein ACWA5P_14355 [bacterium]
MKHYYLFFVLLCIVSCLPDDVLGPDPLGDDTSLIDDITFQQNFGDAVNADFIGTVRNAENEIVSGAQVQIGANTAFTDHNGVFVLNNVSVFERFAYVKVSKEGYLLGTRTIVPSTSSSNHIAITLLEKNVVATIESSEETTVTFNDSKVTFGGAFIDSSGNPYEGQVEVSMHYLAPNVASTYQQMPGALFAQDEGNNAVSLETYGMLAVDLFSSGGEPLNIAEETPAIIEFPVDASQNSIAPTTINLWSFDEAVGYWREEGEATKVGNSYVAEVTHFSWWNVDLPIDVITACISLETAQGALANNYFEIIRNQTGQTIFAGTTNAAGETCGYFPQDENVTIYVYGEGDCQDEIIYEEVLGPYANDTSITITVPDNVVLQSTLTATLTNCDGEPITEGYVYIFDDNSNSEFDSPIIIGVNEGVLNYNLIYCESNVYNAIVYNITNSQNSGLIVLNLLPNETDLSTISTCETTGGIFEGDVILLTQEEVDSFGSLGYTEIIGNLYIGGEEYNNAPGETTNITNLSILSSLTHVSEDVVIVDSGLLQNLNGLDNLSLLGSLYLANNEGLENLNGLQNLIEVDNLLIKGSPMTNLNELQNTTIKNGLGLWSLPFLDDIAALNLTEELVGVEITGCPLIVDSDLTNLFSSVSSLGFVDISFMGINSISFLSDLNIDILILEYNSNLSSLDGLENFTSLQSLYITNSPLVSSLLPLSNLTLVSDRLEISGMENLTSLQGFNSLISIGSLILDGNHNLVTLQSLNSLTSLNNLEIANSSELQSLEVFSSLTSLNRLEIRSNDNISTLQGLHNLNDVSVIQISSNDQLESISALSNITNAYSINISSNPNLQFLDGLNQVTNISNNLSISNSNFQTLDGLNQLNYVGENLRIWANQNLQSLEGLSSLTYANHIEIWDNQNLINLNGLEQLDFSNSLLIGGEATNGGNQSLTDFCALQNLFINGTYSEVDFINNAYNPTVQDIIDGNCSQ